MAETVFHGSNQIVKNPRILVEGPMADDTIWDFVEDFLSGRISRAAFWELAKFKHPTHQISFHTLRAIDCLRYVRCDKV